jgi:uncharacterized protein YciI
VTYSDEDARAQARAMGLALVYVYLLRKGPAWTPEAPDELQAAHLANMRRLRQEGKIVLGGPLADAFQLGGDLRSLGVLKAPSMAVARAWIGTDPMVRAGHLVADVHAWMVSGSARILGDLAPTDEIL